MPPSRLVVAILLSLSACRGDRIAPGKTVVPDEEVDAAPPPPRDAAPREVLAQSAPDAAPDVVTRAELAGYWDGENMARMRASFVIGDDGQVSGLSVRLSFKHANTGCIVTFEHPDASPATGPLTLSSPYVSFKPRVSLALEGAEPRLNVEPYTGPYRIDCGNSIQEGSGPALPADTYKLNRPWRGDRMPPGKRVLGPAGAPVPVGLGANACTHAQGATGDRWCAFARTGRRNEDELWVLNVSRAAAGVAVTCDADRPDPNCLRLTTRLWTETEPEGGTAHPYIHDFTGDTLLFAADPISDKGKAFAGPRYAWRPGWSRRGR